MDVNPVDAGAEPLQFEAMTERDAPPGVVFTFVSEHRRLPSWIPGLRRLEVDESQALSPGGIGTRRTLHPVAGASGVEVVLAFEPPRRMVYSASDESLRGLLTEHRAELCRVVFRYAQRAGLSKLGRRFAAVERSPGAGAVRRRELSACRQHARAGRLHRRKRPRR